MKIIWRRTRICSTIPVTVNAPWYIIPADHKWFTRLAVVSVIQRALSKLQLEYPKVTTEEKDALLKAKADMENESDGPGSTRKKEKKGGRKKA